MFEVIYKEHNELLFICSLIDCIARKTKNKRFFVVENLGKEKLVKMCEQAAQYCCESLDKVSNNFIEECEIPSGCFDNVNECKYEIPSCNDIGKVYRRLIIRIMEEESVDVVEAIERAYHSFVSDKIDDYNSSFYYENPEYILQAYLQGNLIGL